MGPGERKALFERARELSTQQRTWSEADAVWDKVIKAYRAAVRNVREPDRNDQRQLARALWRHSMLLSMLGRAADGLEPGRQAVTWFEQLNEAVAEEERDVTAPRRDEALAELITAMVDLGEVAFAAGDADARIALVDRALGVGLRAVQPPAAGQRTREAMATGYHNYATALLHRHLERGGDVQEAALAGSRALQLRQELLDPRRPISMWELGNTYAVYAQCLALIGELDRARMVLSLGEELVDVLGPAGADIAAKLRAAAEVVDAARKSTKRRLWGRGR
jgi:tetratricopeptide (TPR) repeat protein